MLALSPVWHGRLRAARLVQNLLLQTFVIHPALLFFLLFLLGAHSAGGAVHLLVSEAERLVRNAPAGQVWSCASHATRIETWPSVSDISRDEAAPISRDFKPASPPVTCMKVAESREAWATETNRTLRGFYFTGVLFSIIAGVVVRTLRGRVQEVRL